MTTLDIALVQMRCEKGAIDHNVAAMRRYVHHAAARGVDIVCFPEMSITGYIDPNRQPEAVLELGSAAVEHFVALTAGSPVTAIAGIVEAHPAGKPVITQLVAQAGELLGFYRKKTIVDEEAEWFAPGHEVPLFAHPKARFSLAICADIDSAEIFAEGARRGAQIVFEAAAPGLYGAQATRDWRSGYAWWQSECFQKIGRYARANHVPIAVATQAGRTVDEDFPGGGYLFGPDGACLAATADWSEGVLYASVPLT
jgi:predicted amidohydrolase